MCIFIEEGKRKNIIQLHTYAEGVDNNILTVNHQPLINFGSCSYLGLEFDRRIIEAGKQALDTFGSQFSSSRAYMSLGLYEELEQLLGQIFEAHCIVTPTTTLGHIATIPLVVEEGDAVIVDHQVHSSVQTAVSLLKARGIHTELTRHSNMEQLEEKIIRLQSTHKKVWYMADGIYSMYGDGCPTEQLEILLEKYESFHLYVDDAHGTSCFGKHGRGYVLSKMQLHERMIVAASLNKSFVSGGGVILFPNADIKRKVRNCGGPLIFSGPLQPANLGCAIASAKIHLSDEMPTYQEELQENVRYTQSVIEELGLPYVCKNDSPIFFIGTSLADIAYDTIYELKNKGYYMNLGIFPAVPMKNTGVRFTITRLHTKEQIREMLEAMKQILDYTIEKHGFSYERIYKAFKITHRTKPEMDTSLTTLAKSDMPSNTIKTMAA